MKCIHFICRRGEGLTALRPSVYESGTWDIQEEDAARLVGGLVFLHETKTKPSYFGGRVMEYRAVATDMPHAHRIVFTLTTLVECKGVKWRGKNHGMAWTGGLVED